MPNLDTKTALEDLSEYELADLIDEGSEDAANHAIHLLINHLFTESPVFYELRRRLSFGLHRFIKQKQCADLLNLETGIAWALSTGKKFKPAGKRHFAVTTPKKPKGRKHVDLDQNIRILRAVEYAWSITGRLRDSYSGEGAYSMVSRYCHLSPRAIETRYYSAKRILDNVLTADDRHRASVESSKRFQSILQSAYIDDNVTN